MYKGQSILIPLGLGGLVSDLPQSRMHPSNLIQADNITLTNGYCEKHPGSRPWNRTNPISGSTTISGGIRTFTEYFPDSLNQRVIALSKSGLLYKFSNQFTRVQLTADSGAPSPLVVQQYAHIAIGGQELGGNPKKAFVFSGGSQVQVITGDGATYRPIANPALDWASNYPQFGLVFRGRLWCFGNQNAPDFLYASEEANHENFVQPISLTATDPQFFDVSPGEGSGISGLFVFKNRLFICKSPAGLYQLNDDDPNPMNWYVTRVNADFGLSGSHGIAQVFDDVFILNTQGTVTSVGAAFQFGDIESADVFNKLEVERYFRQNLSGFGLPETYGLYYQDKKQVFFTFRSKSGLKQDRIIVMDIMGDRPQITVTNKDQPNCLGLIQDQAGIGRPVYGADDGNLYEMDIANRWVQSTDSVVSGLSSYNFVAQTPHLDFSYADPSVGTKTKRFDFLEVSFQPTGDWNLLVDVYLDSEFSETISFNLKRDRPLNPAPWGITDDYDFGGYDMPLPATYETAFKAGSVSLQSIGIGGAGQQIIVTNRTTGGLTLVNNYVAGLAPIITGTGADLSIPAQNYALLEYSSGLGVWTVVGVYEYGVFGFQLDVDYLDGDYPKSVRKPLHGQARTISLKLRSEGLSQNIKLQSLMVYFRVADERQMKDPRT